MKLEGGMQSKIVSQSEKARYDTTCMKYTKQSVEVIGSPGTGVPDGCEPPCRCWELDEPWSSRRAVNA